MSDGQQALDDRAVRLMLEPDQDPYWASVFRLVYSDYCDVQSRYTVNVVAPSAERAAAVGRLAAIEYFSDGERAELIHLAKTDDIWGVAKPEQLPGPMR